MTDKDIIEALKCCSVIVGNRCPDCPYFSCNELCREILSSDAFSLIEKKIARIEYLERTLSGVMYFVDKWLDGEELEQDEINRANTMREKTLRIVEEKQYEIYHLKAMSRWISAKEELPPENIAVLCLINSAKPYRWYTYALLMLDDGEWKQAFDNKLLHYEYQVTHWMLLPEQPKEICENAKTIR